MVVPLEVTMKRANVSFNYHDYLQLPEDKRYEILDGELCVVPAPNTCIISASSREIGMALSGNAESQGIGEVLHAPCDVVLSEENIVQPDILFVRQERLRHHPDSRKYPGAAGSGGRDSLGSTAAKDLEIKRKLYAKFGVREYWIVDPDAATVEVLVWSESGYVSAGVYGITDRLSSPLLPELNLPLSGIFKKE